MSLAERVGKSTASKIIKETCDAIWTALYNIAFPSLNVDKFVQIADGFLCKWNFPNCMGSIDGKHVVMQAPANSGAANYNYNHTFSVVLMAVCDANYCFTSVDIGAPGRQNVSRTFSNWNFGQAILNETLPLPQPITLFGNQLPPVFVADEAFPLKVNIMRPFPNRDLLPQKRVYNYRLSRARRLIEKSFGILASRWRMYRQPILAMETTVDAIIKATVCLYNFLQQKSNRNREEEEETHSYYPANLVDYEDEERYQPGRWRQIQMDGLQPVRLYCASCDIKS